MESNNCTNIPDFNNMIAPDLDDVKECKFCKYIYSSCLAKCPRCNDIICKNSIEENSNDL